MRAYGVTYFDAHGEADQLCAMLTITGKVWGCMSEDMDMFIYGCPRIIRYFNINNENVKLYNVENILYELNVTFNNFKQICILSGTDYNLRDNKYNLSRSIDLYNQYQKYINLRTYEKPLEFIEWIFKHIDSSLNCELLYKINYMFDLFDGNKLEKFRNILIMNNSQYI
jgi:5'-3' exonuclease